MFFKKVNITIFWVITTLIILANVGMTQTDWEKYPGNPVLDLGESGTWDDHDVDGPDVLFDGTEYQMWYDGYDGSNHRIGYASSADGIVWTKHPDNPVLNLGASGTWDDYGVGHPTVLFDGTEYQMWYGGYDGLNTRIGYATSADGIEWEKHSANPVLDLGESGTWDDAHIGAPTVLFNGTEYQMWYAARGANYRIGYASSTDGIVWTKHPDNPVLDLGESGTWDDYGVYSPTVLFDGAEYQMWYSGSDGSNGRIGYATSADGIVWTKHPDNPVLDIGESGTWDDAHIGYATVLFNGTEYQMWYSGHDGPNWRIGYATSVPTRAYYAVIAGVADYPGTGNDLEYTDDDAIDIKNSLLLYENWEDGNIQLLLDSEANKSNIQTAIETMGSMADSDDVCLLFFSGHGTNGIDIAPIDESDGLDEYICAHDENIRDDELSIWLGNLPTTNVVVIVDTCFSGGQIKVVDDFGTQATQSKGFTPKVLPGTTGVVQKGDGFASDITRRIGVQDMDDNPGCVVLAACDDDELSWEFGKLENGLFSYFVISGLEKNVDRNENGELSAEETGKYAKFIVNLLNRILPFLKQHPQLYDDYPAGMPQSDELTVCAGEPEPVTATHDEDIEDIIGLAAPAVVVAPKSSKLLQNYSNPFNPDTWIPYQLSEGADVTIRIYNVTGQLVRVLNLGHKPAGFFFSKAQAAYWDGRNEAGERVSSGVYFYQLRAGGFAAMRRMVILK